MEAPSLLHWVSDIDYFNWLVWLFTPVAVECANCSLTGETKKKKHR